MGFLKDLGVWVFLRFLDLTVFGFWIVGSFRDLDRFRLLIQRCKSVREIGNFFDKGRVLPDERKNDPTNAFEKVKWSMVKQRFPSASEGNERGGAWCSRAQRRE